jgi:tricorn protease
VEIDVAGIDQRIVALGLPPREYTWLAAGADGILFLAETVPNQEGSALHRYDMDEREDKLFLEGVDRFALSRDGARLLYRAGEQWGIVKTEESPSAGDGALSTDAIRLLVDPRSEWRQIYREAWRLHRDYFYDTGMHGADWQSIHDKYLPFLDDVAHRTDLSYLLATLAGELSVGHSFVLDPPDPEADKRPRTGLLGADLEVDHGRYRVRKIYTGENWNPDLRAPLSAPGIEVKEGDYILEVNGVELRAPAEPYSLFAGTADRQTTLRIGATPDARDSRLVSVTPVPSEEALRARAWIEGNRRRVDQLSGGRLAYVYLPDTGEGGYTYFNRYYFSQQDKAGAILDERFNGGGSVADYMVDIMGRRLRGFFNNSADPNRPFTVPGAGLFGPKVMIINESAGSGGDFLPYLFRLAGIGPLVGTRTWGGLVGIWDFPSLMDGGVITVPRGGFYNLGGAWDVENAGVSPDIEVEQTPREVAAGQDPQLERAVAEAMKLLAQSGGERRLPQPPSPRRVLDPVD